MRYFFLAGFIVFFQLNSICQRNFTIVFQHGKFPVDSSDQNKHPALHVVIRDTVSFCYYPDSTKKIKTPLGISYIPKATYYDVREKRSYTFLDPKRVYEMDEPDDKCIVTGEKKIICGYNCVRATITKQRQKLIVWVTSELPAGFAPFYLHSLPGTVLASYNESNGYYFLASEVKTEALEIVKPVGKKAPKILTEIR